MNSFDLFLIANGFARLPEGIKLKEVMVLLKCKHKGLGDSVAVEISKGNDTLFTWDCKCSEGEIDYLLPLKIAEICYTDDYYGDESGKEGYYIGL